LMRVSILTATGAWGGAEVHALNLAEVLKNRRHEVTIVELGHFVYDDHVGHSRGIQVIHVGLPKSLEKLTFGESFKLLKGLISDVVVFEKGELDTANWRFDAAARICSKRYISIEQLICAVMPPRVSGSHLGGFLPGFGLWWYRTFWNRYARSLGPHSIVCVSEAVRSRLVNDYDFSPQKTITIHNGIHTSKFRPDPELRAAARRTWGIPNEDMVLGAVGRLAPVKAYDFAIAAFKELKSRIRDRSLWLVLVGDGPSRTELEGLVKENGLQDSVKFPGSTERPWEIYPGFDVFVMPSLLEGLPHALLEAMASECVPIATAVGGIPEIIANPSMGWLVSDRDQEGFLSAMKQAVGCPSEQLVEMGRRARERVISHFDAKGLFDRLADLIEFGIVNRGGSVTDGQMYKVIGERH
jgi:glycosyltransferase involved in cell wall biosynthesis